MKTTLLGISLAMVLGAGVASAQPYFAVRPSYAPAGMNFSMGSYQLQNVQEWVPGGQQQQWVNGQCPSDAPYGYDGNGSGCTAGSYQMVSTPGYYATVQRWVWVPMPAVRYAPPVRVVVTPPVRYGVGYGYGYGYGRGYNYGGGYRGGNYGGNYGGGYRGGNYGGGNFHGAHGVGGGNGGHYGRR